MQSKSLMSLGMPSISRVSELILVIMAYLSKVRQMLDEAGYPKRQDLCFQ